MTNVVSLDDYRECELLGSINIYRQPGGSITLGATYMDTRQIDSVATISDRFRLIAEWLTDGMASLEEQAANFKEAEPTT